MWALLKLKFTAYKWLILLTAVLVAGIGTNIWSFSQGKKVERASWLSLQLEAIAQQDLEREKLAEMGRLAVNQFSQKEKQIRRLKDELDKQVAGATDGRVCFANWDAVRLWNESLAGAQRLPGDTGKPADRPTGTAAVTDADILKNHIDNGARWQQCREQVREIRELYNKQRGK
jgi:hypothetical protein